MRPALLLALALLALTGCGGSPAPAPGASLVAPAPPSVAQAMSLLQSAHLPIELATEYNAATDPNHLLGRPHQYTGKLAWRDTRLPDHMQARSAPGVEDGGTLEIFASAADRDTWDKYVAAFARSGPLFSEYDDPIGRLAELRLAHLLTPDMEAGYRAALAPMT